MAESDKIVPLLVVKGVRKEYSRGFLMPEVTFSLEADFAFEEPAIVGVMGANGAGKTTLFEMITGTAPPNAGRIYCRGQNIQDVKYRERDRLAIHYHQSYQVRRIKYTKPGFLLQPAASNYPFVHLFDQPQFNPQDGYIKFMVNFFKKLRSEGLLVFISLHPTEAYQIDILKEICEAYIFVHPGYTRRYDTWEEFVAEPHIRQYLSNALTGYEVPQRLLNPDVRTPNA